MADKRNKNTTQAGKSSRRTFVGTSAAVLAGTTVTGFPNLAFGAETLRTVGLGVSVINEIQGRASKDLGARVRGEALGSGAMFDKILNQNDQYEIAEGYYEDLDVLIPAKVWQPIDTTRIKDWEKVTDLTKTGRLTPESNLGHPASSSSFMDKDATGNTSS